MRRTALVAIVLLVIAIVAAVTWLDGFGDRSSPSTGRTHASQTVPAGEPAGLVYRFDVGTSYRYNVATLMQGTLTKDGSVQPYREQAFALVSVTPTSVDANGVVTATVEQVSGRSVVNGEEVALSPGSATVRIRPDGAIVQVSNPFGAAILQQAMLGFPGTNQFLPILPTDDVDNGDSWSTIVPQELPDVDAAISFETNSTLLGPARDSNSGDVMMIREHVALPLDVRFDARPGLEAAGLDVPAQADASVTLSGSGELDSTVEFDEAEGALKFANANGQLEMAIRQQGFPPGAGGDSTIQFSGLIGFAVQGSS